MAELTYNGVALNFLSTQQVDFEPVYDDMAGLDYLYTRVVIVCTAVITPNVAPAAVGETATAAMARVSHLLNTPRRGLTFKVGGVNLVSVVAGNGDTTIALRDAQNGPYPHATITRIIGTESLMVMFRVETHVVDCPENDTRAQQYVSHRWTETAEINENAMTRRTRQGRIVARADLLANADQLRHLVAPPLEKDFLRTSSRYTLQADGRVLAYEFIDEEQFLMPPNPAAKAEGRFSITCKDGASFFAECTLRLVGAKSTDKSVLMIRAMSIALAKIQSANPPQDGKTGNFTLKGFLSEDMYANDVRVSLTAQVAPAKGRVTSMSTGGISGGPNTAPTPIRADGSKPGVKSPSNFDWLKVPANHSDGTGGRFDPGTRGSAQLLLIAAALQDPCLRISVQTATQQSTSLQSGNGSTTPAQISIASLIPDSQSLHSNSDLNGVYEHYEVSSMTSQDDHIIAMPVGKKDSDAAIIRVGSSVARRRVTWRAIKVGGRPKVPNPKLKDPNWTLVKAQIDPEQVEPVADGVALRYCVSGCMDYVAKSAAKVNIAAAVPPWVDSAAFTSAGQPYELASDILEPSGTVTLQTGPWF